MNPSTVRTLRTIGGFAVTAAVVETVLRWLAAGGRFLWLQEWTASAAAAGLRLLGQRVVLSGCSVVVGGGSVTVAELCLPITPVAVAAGLFLFATPTKPARRAVWFVSVVIALALVNVVRIMVVALFLASDGGLATIVHRDVLPVVLVGIVIACWMIELRRTPAAS